MDAVVFDGKEYIKASVLAERFKYTADYLGQLCRGKKVDARLVGRAWYINLDSLKGHKDTRYQAAKKSAAPDSKDPAKSHFLDHIDVEPILKNKTVKIFKAKSGRLSEFSVKYEADDYSLIPKMNKEAVSVGLPITPAGAEKVKVAGEKVKANHTQFRPEVLPEVYLKGRLTVEGLKEATEPIEEKVEEVKDEVEQEIPLLTKMIKIRRRTVVKPDTLPAKEVAKVPPPSVVADTARPVPLVKGHIQTDHTSAARKIILARDSDATTGKVTENHLKPTQTPDFRAKRPTSRGVLLAGKGLVKGPETQGIPHPEKVSASLRQRHDFTPTTVKNKTLTIPPPPKPVSIWVPVGTLGAALIVAFMVITTSVEVVAGKGSYTDRLVIKMANLAEYEVFLPW